MSLKIGERVGVEKFHISKMNVRVDESFGDSEEDQQLITNLSRGEIIGPFKVREEGEGYGVIVGRRRFLGKKEAGAKDFVYGRDFVIENLTDEQAKEASLVENLKLLRKDLNPVTRARALNELISNNPAGLRDTARRIGISKSTLSDWLKVLDLSQNMQDKVAKGLLLYTDAVQLSKMSFGMERQDELAEVLEKEGNEAFQEKVKRYTGKGLKRGIPAGKYEILRITFDKVYKPDMNLSNKLKELAEAKHQKVDEYAKWVLEEHVKAKKTWQSSED